MAYQDRYTYFSPTKLIVGRGSIDQIPDALSARGLEKPLIVTDEGLVSAGLVKRVTDVLDAASIGYATYDGVAPNPPVESVEGCVEAYQAGGCDGLIAVGGGSSMDTAKTAGVVITNGGQIQDYFRARGGGDNLKERIPFLLCVPTTYGTGSEVTPFAVVTDEHHYKDAVAGPQIIPDVGILDSDMAVALPFPIAGATGMDALTHAIESYTNLRANPISDGLAAQAIRMIAENLRQAAANDHNHEATENMLVASATAALAFSQTLLGNVHAMSHPVSGHFGVAHGVANAILLTRVMEYNLIACPDKFAQIAVLMGEEVDNVDDMSAGLTAVQAVASLGEDVGIPETLSDVGVTEDKLGVLCEDSMRSANVAINPRKTTIEDVRNIYEAAL